MYTEKQIKELIQKAYDNGRYDERRDLVKHGLGLPSIPSPLTPEEVEKEAVEVLREYVLDM